MENRRQVLTEIAREKMVQLRPQLEHMTQKELFDVIFGGIVSVAEYDVENYELKDRIAELETENKMLKNLLTALQNIPSFDSLN